MPRDPSQLTKAALVEELREKHGVEEVELSVPEPPGFGTPDFQMPEGVEARMVPDPDFEPGPDAPEVPPFVPEFFETKPVEDATKDRLLDEFGGLLDTTTEEEREEATREAVDAENALAEQPPPEAAPEKREPRRRRRVPISALPPEQRLEAIDRLYDAIAISADQRDRLKARAMEELEES